MTGVGSTGCGAERDLAVESREPVGADGANLPRKAPVNPSAPQGGRVRCAKRITRAASAEEWAHPATPPRPLVLIGHVASLTPY